MWQIAAAVAAGSGSETSHSGTYDSVSDDPTEQAGQPDDMGDADTANGENPDPGHEHETGERQADENRENDPPA